MITDEKLIRTKDLLVPAEKKISLKDYSTKYKGKELNKKEAEMLLEMSRKGLAEIQDELYAHNRYSVLIIFKPWMLRAKTVPSSTSCRDLIRWV